MAVKNKTLRETIQYLRLVEKKTAKEVETLTGVKPSTQYGYIQPEKKWFPIRNEETNEIEGYEFRDNPRYRRTQEGLYKTSGVNQRNVRNARRRQLKNREFQLGAGRANGVNITDAFVEQFIPTPQPPNYIANRGVLLNARTDGSGLDIINMLFEGRQESEGAFREFAFNVELIGLPAGTSLLDVEDEINEEIIRQLDGGASLATESGSDPIIELNLIEATFMSLQLRGSN